MLKTVLAAVDGSLSSRKAAAFAGGMARQFGARLAILHVVEPLPEAVAAPLGLTSANLRELQLKEGQAILSTLCRDLALGEALQLLTLGRAPEAICREAEDCDADMIVIGSHGHGAYPSVLLGSVGSRVANLSSRTVAIIR